MAKGKQGVDIIIDGKHITAESLTRNLSKAGEFMKHSLDPNRKYMNEFLGKSILPTMKRLTKRRFSTKLDPSGKPWKKLSPFTVAQRTKRGTLGKGILLETGKLKRGIKPRRSFGVVSLISTVSYGLIHQPPASKITIKNGVRGRWITKAEGQISEEFKFDRAFIPERVFMGFDKEMIKKADAQIMKFIKSRVKSFLNILSKEGISGIEQFLNKGITIEISEE